MEDTVRLNEAFQSFTQASRRLEVYYEKLGERVKYLTNELERKNAQLNRAVLETSESRNYLQTVLQSIGEAMIVLDRDSRVTMVNRAAEKLLDIDLDEVRNTFFDDMDIAIEEHRSGSELKVKNRKYDVIVSRSPVADSEGLVKGYVILIKNITDIRELERQQERNSRLISMGEMAAQIVHEIRSPLCSIELFSSMLSDDLKNTPHSDIANGISEGIKSLNNILTNMLLFARNQKLSFAEVKLDSVVDESVRMLTPLMEARGIKLLRDIKDASVTGDGELLKQVFMNIILNAVQAMPEGGQLKISAIKEGKFTGISVVDEGEGICAENIEKIFNPFFSTKDRGTGLGLAIAHKIIQSHDGFIRVFSNTEKGSTFCIYLPANETNARTDSEEHLCMQRG